MKLDRALQRLVLEQLRDSYPDSVDLTSLACSSHEHYQANLHYLYEHRLLDGSRLSDRGPGFVMGRITATGLDFLEGDGGLSAILPKGAAHAAEGVHGTDT